MFFFRKISFKINSVLFLKFIGFDMFGNSYYIHRFKKNSTGKFLRFCFYKGIAEPSKVPPLYHSWLHYTLDDNNKNLQFCIKNYNKYSKTHLPNLTGTIFSNNPRYSNKKKHKYEKWIHN